METARQNDALARKQFLASMRRQGKSTSDARRYRRYYENALKRSNLDLWKDYKAEKFERAKELINSQREFVKAHEEKWLIEKQTKMIASFKEFGYSDEVIDKKIEQWLDGIKLMADKW